MCGGKKIKNIGSVSVSVYMLSVCNIVSMSVFTCQNGLLFLFIVVSLLLSGRPLHLLPTYCVYTKKRLRQNQPVCFLSYTLVGRGFFLYSLSKSFFIFSRTRKFKICPLRTIPSFGVVHLNYPYFVETSSTM